MDTWRFGRDFFVEILGRVDDGISGGVGGDGGDGGDCWRCGGLLFFVDCRISRSSGGISLWCSPRRRVGEHSVCWYLGSLAVFLLSRRGFIGWSELGFGCW